MKDSLIVLSGGMDSVTLLHQFKDRIALAVSFDYGSNHNDREIGMAAANCRILGTEHIVIPLAFMAQYFRSSLLSGAAAVPEGHYSGENIKSTVVPFRNGIMLAVAAGLAESRGLSHIMLANHAGDHTIYPDCRPEFVKGMNDAVVAGTGGQVTFIAPYTDLTKGQIAAIGQKLGIDYALTYSCYKGGEKHCGRCATCLERKEALAEAGIADPTVYEA